MSENQETQKVKFNPQAYLTKIKGKNYLEVKYRIHWMRDEHKLWDVQTSLIKIDLEKGVALVKADIYDDNNKHLSSGLKMEYAKNFPDYLEKAETGSIGRALAVLGYGTLQCFDMDEGIEKGRIADSPVSANGYSGNDSPNEPPMKASSLAEKQRLAQEKKQQALQKTV